MSRRSSGCLINGLTVSIVRRARCSSPLLCLMTIRHDKRRCFRIVAQLIVAIAEDRVPLGYAPRSGSPSLRLNHPHR